MTKIVAGAFDDFASAQAAAEDLRDSGGGNVQITNNAKNPDGSPGTTLADEAATVPGIVQRVASTLFNVNEHDPVEGQPVDEIGVGGIVVSVAMGVGDAPRAVTMAIGSLACWTRNFMPLRSASDFISFLLL